MDLYTKYGEVEREGISVVSNTQEHIQEDGLVKMFQVLRIAQIIKIEVVVNYTQFNSRLINVDLQVSDFWRNFAQVAGVSNAAPKTLLLKWWVYTD